MRQRKRRVSLNILGILVGISAITALLSITQGMNVAISEQMESLGPRTVIVMAGRGGMGGMGGGGGAFGAGGVELEFRDVESIEKIPGVSIATPIVSGTAEVRARGEVLTGVTVMGVIPDEIRQVYPAIEVAEGRHLRRGDRVAVVLGTNIAYPPWLDESVASVGGPITLVIKANGEEEARTFRVAGILSEVGPGFGSPDDQILVTIETAKRLFNARTVNQIIVQAKIVDDVDSVVEEIRDELGEEVMAISAAFLRGMVGQVTGLIQATLVGVAAISLVVAAIGIINTMTITVMERTREIGVMKALGADNRSVLMVFLAEAALTGLAGGLIGVVLGFLLGQVVSTVIAFQYDIAIRPVPSVELGLVGIAFAVLAGVLAGLYPSRRAAKLEPVEALRYE